MFVHVDVSVEVFYHKIDSSFLAYTGRVTYLLTMMIIWPTMLLKNYSNIFLPPIHYCFFSSAVWSCFVCKKVKMFKNVKRNNSNTYVNCKFLILFTFNKNMNQMDAFGASSYFYCDAIFIKRQQSHCVHKRNVYCFLSVCYTMVTQCLCKQCNLDEKINQRWVRDTV